MPVSAAEVRTGKQMGRTKDGARPAAAAAPGLAAREAQLAVRDWDVAAPAQGNE